MIQTVEAIWSGSYPNLCRDYWTLIINGIDYSKAIPYELRHSHMNTAGTYSRWHFEDWREVFDNYEDGLEFNEWIAENEWVRALPADPLDVYLAFNAQDWRPGECGGCI